MSHPAQRLPPPPVRRASWLLLLACVVGFLDLAVAITAKLGVSAGAPQLLGLMTDDQGRQEEALQIVAHLQEGLLLIAWVSGIGAILLLLAAIGIRQPIRTIRAATWCLGGLLAFSLCCGVVDGPDTPVSPVNWTPEQLRAVDNLVGEWFTAAHGAAIVAMLVVIAAVTVLLLRDDASDFYRLRHQKGGPSLSTFIRGVPEPPKVPPDVPPLHEKEP